MNRDVIIQEARRAHGSFWHPTSDEGTGDRQAAAVTQAWQVAVTAMPDVVKEVQVASCLTERIDVVDRLEGVAYELKVSGKNPHHEFYRDVFKVVAYNELGGGNIQLFVFLTEASAAKRLSAGLAAFVTSCGNRLGFEVSVVGL